MLLGNIDIQSPVRPIWIKAMAPAKVLTTKQRLAIDWSEFPQVVTLLAALYAYYHLSGKLNAGEIKWIGQNRVPIMQFFAALKVPTTHLQRAIGLALRKASGEDFMAELEQFAPIARSKHRVLQNSPINPKLFNLYRNLIVLFSKDSESAFRNVLKSISLLRTPWLNQIFMPVKVKHEPAIKALRTFIQRETGAARDWLTKDEAEKLKASSAARYKQYLALNREVANAYKANLVEIIRASGEHSLPAKVIKKELQQRGFSAWQIPQGYVDNIGEDGYYTRDGKPLVMPQVGGWVKRNPAYDPKSEDSYVYVGQALRATQQARYYTANQTHKREAKKEELLNELQEKLPVMRKQWLHDMLRGSASEKIHGAMLETLYQTGARVGSRIPDPNDPTGFGISTLTVNHVRQLKNGVRIRYIGKDGVEHIHSIVGGDDSNAAKIRQALVKTILNLTAGKGGRDHVFAESGRRVTSTDANKYMRELGYTGSVHKLRRLRGTKVLLSVLEHNPFTKKNPTQKDAEDYMKAKLLQVGQELGHIKTNPKTGEKEATWRTAGSAYISHDLQRKFFEDKGLHVPSGWTWLNKRSADD